MTIADAVQVLAALERREDEQVVDVSQRAVQQVDGREVFVGELA